MAKLIRYIVVSIVAENRNIWALGI